MAASAKSNQVREKAPSGKRDLIAVLQGFLPKWGNHMEPTEYQKLSAKADLAKQQLEDFLEGVYKTSQYKKLKAAKDATQSAAESFYKKEKSKRCDDIWRAINMLHTQGATPKVVRHVRALVDRLNASLTRVVD